MGLGEVIAQDTQPEEQEKPHVLPLFLESLGECRYLRPRALLWGPAGGGRRGSAGCFPGPVEASIALLERATQMAAQDFSAAPGREPRPPRVGQLQHWGDLSSGDPANPVSVKRSPRMRHEARLISILCGVIGPITYSVPMLQAAALTFTRVFQGGPGPSFRGRGGTGSRGRAAKVLTRASGTCEPTERGFHLGPLRRLRSLCAPTRGPPAKGQRAGWLRRGLAFRAGTVGCWARSEGPEIRLSCEVDC